MAVQQQLYACTIPAGRTKASPETVQMQLGVFTVTAIRWRVPPGFSGQVGFYLASSGFPVVPFAGPDAPAWIVADDESDTVALTELPDSGDWQLVGYNLGTYDHTVYVTFTLDLPVSVATVTPIPLTLLSSG